MSTIKISELATSAISLTDFFAKADSAGLANKNTVQELSNFLNTVGALAFRGVLLAADAAVTLDGVYVAGDAGTYTNNGGLVITVSNQIVLISITGTQTVFEKVEIPITLTIDAIPTDGSVNAVESGGVFDIKTALVTSINLKANDLVDLETLYDFTSATIGEKVNLEGTFTASGGAERTDYLSVIGYDEVYISGSISALNVINFYEADNTFISGNVLGSGTDVKVLVPVNATQCVLQQTASSDTLFLKTPISLDEIINPLRIQVLDNKNDILEKADNLIETKELYNNSVLTNSGKISLTGNIEASGGGIYSDLLTLGSFKKTYISGNFSSLNIINYYDVGGSWISGDVLSNGTEVESIHPSNATQCRLQGIVGENVTSLKVDVLLPEKLSNIDSTTLSNTNRIVTLENESVNTKPTTKFIHFSFDDVIDLFEVITDNAGVYTSLFDNPMLSFCKNLHDTYGAVFSFYCFNEDADGGVWDISQTTTVFKSEFEANSNWLKFGHHAQDRNTNYIGATALYAQTQYNIFSSAIEASCGINSIDKIPRLGGFAGSLDACVAMRDLDGGILGLLSPDDNRLPYYITEPQRAYLSNKDRWYDYETFLNFFKSDIRIENEANMNATLATFLDLSNANKSNDLLIFTHEGLFNAEKSKLTDVCIWGDANGYNFKFPMDVLLGK